MTHKSPRYQNLGAQHKRMPVWKIFSRILDITVREAGVSRHNTDPIECPLKPFSTIVCCDDPRGFKGHAYARKLVKAREPRITFNSWGDYYQLNYSS